MMKNLSRIFGCLIVLALLGCQAEMRKDNAPSAQEEPLANPPKPGDDFYDFGEVPKGAPVVKGYEFEEEQQEARNVAAPPAVEKINRESLISFVGQGPRRPFEMVEIEPAFRGSQFIGYQIKAFSEEGARSFGSAVRAGDIVVAVNDRNVALPEDYMAAWASLKTCQQLSVRLIRGGEQVDLSWPVVD